MEINNQNSYEWIKTIPDKSIDLLFTDPPYQLDIHGGGAGGFRNRKLLNKHISYIGKGFDYKKIFPEFLRVLKTPNMLIFCSNKQISTIMNYWEKLNYSVTLLVWQKTNPIPLCNSKYVSDLEFIIYVRGKNATFNNTGYHNQLKIFTYPAPRKRIHPTEKPISLLRRLLLTHSNKNDTVLDPFAGSFSTAIACHQEKRNFIGNEIDKEMFLKAKKRLDIFTKQKLINFA